MDWRRIHAEGCEWEVRVIAGVESVAGEDILEFRALDAARPPRRLAVEPGAVEQMDEAGLHAAHRKARPIGADHYGRAGKQMPDTGTRD